VIYVDNFVIYLCYNFATTIGENKVMTNMLNMLLSVFGYVF